MYYSGHAAKVQRKKTNDNNNKQVSITKMFNSKNYTYFLQVLYFFNNKILPENKIKIINKVVIHVCIYNYTKHIKQTFKFITIFITVIQKQKQTSTEIIHMINITGIILIYWPKMIILHFYKSLRQIQI